MKALKCGMLFMTLLLCSQLAKAQVGAGLTFNYDLYNLFSNPDDGLASGNNGSALLGFGLGPKLWFGKKKFALTVEAQAAIAPLGLSVKDYKGLGAVSFPIMAKLNFGGMAGYARQMEPGFSIGGGLQYNKTEIFGLSQEYLDLGVTRDYYKTYNVQVAGGVGISGFVGSVFARYGFNPDLDGASNLHIGVQADFNFQQLKKIERPESAL